MLAIRIACYSDKQLGVVMVTFLIFGKVRVLKAYSINKQAAFLHLFYAPSLDSVMYQILSLNKIAESTPKSSMPFFDNLSSLMIQFSDRPSLILSEVNTLFLSLLERVATFWSSVKVR